MHILQCQIKFESVIFARVISFLTVIISKEKLYFNALIRFKVNYVGIYNKLHILTAQRIKRNTRKWFSVETMTFFTQFTSFWNHCYYACRKYYNVLPRFIEIKHWRKCYKADIEYNNTRAENTEEEFYIMLKLITFFLWNNNQKFKLFFMV